MKRRDVSTVECDLNKMKKLKGKLNYRRSLNYRTFARRETDLLTVERKKSCYFIESRIISNEDSTY